MKKPLTFLLLSNYLKGQRLLDELHRLGCHSVLLADESVRHKPWPAVLNEKFFMPDLNNTMAVTRAVSYLARSRRFDGVIALDDYSVQLAATMREHMRLSGMGETTARYFRDKLAMRKQAREVGVNEPDFVHVLNHHEVHEFTRRVAPPWVLKPRSEAGSVKIKKLHSELEVWQAVSELGDDHSFYLLEQYIPGQVLHVDSIVYGHKMLFAQPHRYWRPPFDVWNKGGVFISQTMASKDPMLAELKAMNERVVLGLGLQRGVTHAEFIQGEDGKLYFLEIAARVCGAHLDVEVEAASGIDLWREWGRLEAAYLRGEDYKVPKRRNDNAGLLLCLSRQQSPDLSTFGAGEVVWRLAEEFHAGLVMASNRHDTITRLLHDYNEQLTREVLAVAPPTDKPM